MELLAILATLIKQNGAIIILKQYQAGNISGKRKRSSATCFKNWMAGNYLILGPTKASFSCLAAAKEFDVVAIDKDDQCINTLYKKVKEENITNILPLCMDLMNPSPASGFANNERASFRRKNSYRCSDGPGACSPPAIGYNLPLSKIAEYLYGFSHQLIIEFVPKEDEKVQLLLQNKKDIYPEYTREHFENVFRQRFTITEKVQVPDSNRIIYLMKRIN
jgi:hypothetical protein